MKFEYFFLDKHCTWSIIYDMSKDIQEQLREAICKSELSCYKISQLAGVSESQLSFFMNHKRSLTLDSAAPIAAVLGLELKPKKSRKRG